jgi:drug/metabolite transporter (DMT)-like permease
MLIGMRNLQFMACMVLAAACWGFATVMSKDVLTYFAPLNLIVIQLTASTVFLWTALAAKRARIPLNHSIFGSALLGLLSPGLADTISLIGLSMTTASMSTLIWDFQPIVILVLAFLVLRERITRPLGAFSFLATLGVVLVAGVGLNAQGHNILLGNILTLLGVFICSTYFVLTSRIFFLLALISEAVGAAYRIEENESEERAWVGDVSSMLKSLGEPKVKLKEGIGIMIKQRYSAK